MRLADIMTTEVERVRLSDTPQRARTLMQLRKIHHLVVVDNSHVVGMLTAEDLRGAESTGAETIAALVTRRPISAPPELTVRKAANLLRGTNSGALPVLDHGRLVGIVTVSDLLDLLGRGAAHPTPKGQRWTLRDRGVRPNAARPPRPARGR